MPCTAKLAQHARALAAEARGEVVDLPQHDEQCWVRNRGPPSWRPAPHCQITVGLVCNDLRSTAAVAPTFAQYHVRKQLYMGACAVCCGLGQVFEVGQFELGAAACSGNRNLAHRLLMRARAPRCQGQPQVAEPLLRKLGNRCVGQSRTGKRARSRRPAWGGTLSPATEAKKVAGAW